jgi:hypothetical protein
MFVFLAFFCLVIPAKAGIHEHRFVCPEPPVFMDPGFRRGDG